MTPEKRAWYELMIADEVRSAAYKRALAMYAPGRPVVDVGAGLGHLSLWALEAGAKQAVLIEQDSDVLDAAEQTTLRCFPAGTTPAVELVPGPSWEIELLEGCMGDVVVAEVFDSSGVGEGAIATLKDARRFLRPGGIMIPDWMRLHLCLLYEPVPAQPGKLATLAPTDEWHSPSPWFDWCPGEETGVHVQSTGDVHGFGLAFTLGLAPGVTLTNLPGHPKTHWGQGAMSFGATPLRVERGQVLIVRGEVDHTRDRRNPDVRFDITRIEGA